MRDFFLFFFSCLNFRTICQFINPLLHDMLPLTISHCKYHLFSMQMTFLFQIAWYHYSKIRFHVKYRTNAWIYLLWITFPFFVISFQDDRYPSNNCILLDFGKIIMIDLILVITMFFSSNCVLQND